MDQLAQLRKCIEFNLELLLVEQCSAKRKFLALTIMAQRDAVKLLENQKIAIDD